ncbi:autotransporter outer membrane beta-barrel domain-containing protein, partial [Vibrio sp. S11_S32]|uniref:autotransporter outer membrane beta-barrel domain-containing protein n=1 Tax=Vibrio sp. S11_S32 TaxID=2720225 RepID=UPI001681B6D7
GNMPALLAAAQVKTPSADNQVSVQLTELPAQSLTTHQGVTTPNQQSSANLLVASHAQGNANTQSALSTLTNDQVSSHLNSIHAEPYSSNMTVALEHTDMVMNSVFSQVGRKAFSPNVDGAIKDTTPATRQRMWLDIGKIQGDVEGEEHLGDYDYNLSHLTLGGDIAEFDKATLGMYFSTGTYDMDEHDSASVTFSNKAYHLGLYLNQPDLGQWQLKSLLGYAYGNHSSSRGVQLSNLSTNATADYNSHSLYAGIMATTNWYSNDWVALSSGLGFNYVYFKQEGFSEKGDDPSLSLQLDDSDAQSIITSLGLSATFASLSENYAIYPEAYIRYEHDWYANKNNEHEVSAGLVSNPNYKQDFVGQSRGENSITVGLGLTSDVTSAVQINGGFTATESTHGSEWGGSLNVSYRW